VGRVHLPICNSAGRRAAHHVEVRRELALHPSLVAQVDRARPPERHDVAEVKVRLEEQGRHACCVLRVCQRLAHFRAPSLVLRVAVAAAAGGAGAAAAGAAGEVARAGRAAAPPLQLVVHDGVPAAHLAEVLVEAVRGGRARGGGCVLLSGTYVRWMG
jgi:hypothetical protein